MNGKDSEKGNNVTEKQEDGHSQVLLDSPCVQCHGLFYQKRCFKVIENNNPGGISEESLEIYEVGKNGYAQSSYFNPCVLCKGVLCSSKCSRMHRENDCVGLVTSWGKTEKRMQRQRKIQNKQLGLKEIPLGDQEKKDAKEKGFDLNETPLDDQENK